MGERGGRDWRLDLCVLGGAWAFFFLLHPRLGILWFDYSWIAYNLLPVSFSVAGMNEAIRWQAAVYSPVLVRPARAIQWWLAVKLLGCSALAYHLVSIFTLGLAVWASAWRPTSAWSLWWPSSPASTGRRLGRTIDLLRREAVLYNWGLCES